VEPYLVDVKGVMPRLRPLNGRYEENGVDKQLNVEYPINIMSEFGTILRAKRRAAGLSQRKLAQEAGVDFSYVSKLENGRLPAPAASTVSRFAEVVGCPPEELLAAAKKMPSDLNALMSGDAAALRFLQEASKLGLSTAEWERLTGSLHGLRSSSDEDSEP